MRGGVYPGMRRRPLKLEGLKDSGLTVPPALRSYLDLDGAVLDPTERDRNSTPSSAL